MAKNTVAREVGIEKQVEVTPLDTNRFEVAETTVQTRVVDKKGLKKEVDELEVQIEAVRVRAGLNTLEKDLADKKALLEKLK